MRMKGALISLLSDAEMDRIHHGALKIMAEMGMEIQNQRLLTVLADFGLPVNFQLQRVTFPTSIVEQLISEAQPYDWDKAEPSIGGMAGVYLSRFHDPTTLQLTGWSESSLAYYFALAKSLPLLNGACMLGSRIAVPAPLEPLYERYYCWKFGASEGGSIFLDETCPYLYDLYQARASELSLPLDQVFDATVYLTPAMRLGRHEAYQVDYFRQLGLRVSVGDMYGMGANAPVTLAGAITLNLAEQIALRILDWAWFGVKRLFLGGSLSMIDMRSMMYTFGRPERGLANLMMAQLARRYGVEFHGHAGLTDAKLPSAEAGYQKALSGIPTLMAGGRFWLDAGLLAVDEVVSPIQLILDHEFLSALQFIITEFPVDDESIGIDTILSTGPGGHYLDKEHTVRYLRESYWQPSIWSNEMLGPWMQSKRYLDADKARAIALDFRRSFEPVSLITDSFEREFYRLITQASHQLGLNSR